MEKWPYHLRMNVYFSIAAFVAGSAIAIQATMNSRLGVLLNNSILAAMVVYIMSSIFAFIYFVLLMNDLPDKCVVKSIPLYLWISGGLLSAFAISSMYWLIPRAGIAPMMTF